MFLDLAPSKHKTKSFEFHICLNECRGWRYSTFHQAGPEYSGSVLHDQTLAIKLEWNRKLAPLALLDQSCLLLIDSSDIWLCILKGIVHFRFYGFSFRACFHLAQTVFVCHEGYFRCLQMFLTTCWYCNGWYGVSLFRPKNPLAPLQPPMRSRWG